MMAAAPAAGIACSGQRRDSSVGGCQQHISPVCSVRVAVINRLLYHRRSGLRNRRLGCSNDVKLAIAAKQRRVGIIAAQHPLLLCGASNRADAGQLVGTQQQQVDRPASCMGSTHFVYHMWDAAGTTGVHVKRPTRTILRGSHPCWPSA